MSGSVKVLSDGPIGGGVRYGVPEIGVAGVGASEPVRDILFPARRLAGGIRTAAALHNLGAEAMGVSCRLMSGGVSLEEAEIHLEANGQTSWFIEDTFTATDTSDFLGSVRCTAPGRGRFTAIAVEMDAAERIFNTLSVVPVDRTGGQARGDGPGLCAFRQRDLDHRSGVREPGDPAERSRPHPLSHGHPSEPSRYLFLRHRGQRSIAAESVVNITGDLEVTEDGALTVQHRDGAAGSAHGLDPRARAAGVGIGAGGLGGSHRRDAPV